MSKIKTADIRGLSWSARFAIIDHFNPTDTVICKVFGVDADELTTARELRDKNTITVDTTIDVSAYGSFFNPNARRTATTHTPARTATKAKRGKRGKKIDTAFNAVTPTPVPVTEFAAEHDVSVAVLRQAKRFDKTGGTPVHVKKSKDTGELEIWREAV